MRNFLFGSKGEKLSPSTCFPLRLRQRTCGGCTAMTVSCQQETHAPQQYQRYSITSSAPTSSKGGKAKPIIFAVLRLITSSIFVGNCTGRSAGLAPLRILATSSAAVRYMSRKLGPYDIVPPISTYSRRTYNVGSCVLSPRSTNRSGFASNTADDPTNRAPGSPFTMSSVACSSPAVLQTPTA